MSVKFEDNSIKVKEALDDAAIAYLYEAAGELVAQTQRLMPTKGDWYTPQTNAWTYVVDESKGEAIVGNPLEPILWTEFGTGEHSISPKGGRKGYWVYVKDDSIPGQSYTYNGGKTYTKKEAKQIVAMMRADGKEAYYTKGQKAHRPFFKAFETSKPSLIKLAEIKFKERFDT